MARNSMDSDTKAVSLRQDAENRLRGGSAPQSRGVPLGRQALSLLFDMAGDPERSSDALRLLQELQVHQVELDLQREELENSEHEMRLELARYKSMFKLIPTICMVITREGRIIEANPAAATVLKTPYGELTGQTLHELIQQESQDTWRDMLSSLIAGEHAVSGELKLRTRENDAIKLQLSGSSSAEGDVLLFGNVS